MENILHNSITPESGNEPKKPLDAALKFLPLAQWIVTIIIGIAVFGIGFRDAQKDQSAELSRIQNEQKAIRDTLAERKTTRDKQVEDLKSSLVTREVFTAYMEAIKDEQNRQRQLLEKLLERP